MSVDRWRQLDQVFVGALQLPPEARTPFVERACGNDEALLAEALSLLVADRASEQFLAKPALERLAEGIAGDGRRLRPVLLSLAAGALALGLTAVVLLPFVDALPQTWQHTIRSTVHAQAGRS